MELPECVLTNDLFDSFVECGRQKPIDLAAIKGVVNKLPRPNYVTLHFLMHFLIEVAAKSDVNKMTTFNLAIVFGPTLLHRPDDSILDSPPILTVCQSILENYSVIFPDDSDLKM
eukprot:TRINITY_DN1550_c0_g2_i2.p1 TRINITY_DN1550_c0_g2~~TRINITY_DN1550_c0_g2_i2.p1  ORF type:complete len:115 (-),score=43.78 TRINITY_DN1550_c0_g2_i2:128-472(-)